MSNRPWREAAQKFGWSEADCDLFLSNHPQAENIEFETKFRHVTYDHTSTMEISGTGRDGIEYVHAVKSTRRGSWQPPKRGDGIEKTWSAPRFEGAWCPCHGAAACSMGIQKMERTFFCDCKEFENPPGYKGAIRHNPRGDQNLHRRSCMMRNPNYSPPCSDNGGRTTYADPFDFVATAAEVAEAESEAPVATAPSTPIPAAKKTKAKKREKRIIESLALPGMGGRNQT